VNRHRKIGDLPEGALRDYSTAEGVERVWQRLKPDISPRKERSPSNHYLWLPAAAVAVFGTGVFVGASWLTDTAVPPAVVAEPTLAAESAAAPQPAAANSAQATAQDAHQRQRANSGRRARNRSAAPAPTATEVEKITSLDPPLPVGPPEWQLLADNGQYVEALASVESHGGFHSVLKEATAEQLMLLVDAARVTGQRERAIVALRRVVSQHGTDPNAPLAAWTLGNELTKAGDPDGAAQAFAMYRALSPQGDFAEDALAREFEMALEQGNLEHARKLADQYAEDFPAAPRGADIRARLAEALEEHSAATKSDERERKGSPSAAATVESAATQESEAYADAGVSP
jgi:TolA-binding protein